MNAWLLTYLIVGAVTFVATSGYAMHEQADNLIPVVFVSLLMASVWPLWVPSAVVAVVLAAAKPKS